MRLLGAGTAAPARGSGRASSARASHGGGPPSAAGAESRPSLSSSAVLIVALVGVLDVIGLVMVLSASSVVALRQSGSAWGPFEHQLVWVGIGALALGLTARLDYHLWLRLGPPVVAVTVLLLVAVLVPGVGVHVAGSSRWIGVGQFRVQPSELMKLALVVFGAGLLARRAGEIGDWRRTVRPVAVVVLVGGGLVMVQPDMGTTLVLVAIAFALLFAASVPLRVMGRLLAGSAALAFLLGLAQPYRRARLLSFIDPWAHRSGSGYQVVQSLVGLGSGGLFGVGLGASRAKWGFLPNSYTDFIFSIIGEELGLLGCLLVIGLFIALAVVGIRVARQAPDRLGALLAAGVSCWIAAQAVMNIGAAIGVLPVAGVPLPFVSFGGSSLVIIMAATGILVNVASRGRRPARA